MKYSILYTLIYFASFLGVKGQNTSQELQQTLDRLKEVADSSAYDVLVKYEHLLEGSTEFEEFDHCKMIRRGGKQFYSFTKYDAFYDGSFYIKVQKDRGEIYVFEGTQDGGIDEDMASPIQLDFTNLYADTIKSKPEQGYVRLLTKQATALAAVEIEFNPGNHQLKLYRFRYKKGMKSPYLGLQIRVEQNSKTTRLPQREDYFSIKNDNIYLTQAYEKLRLITNKKLPQ